jgi:hypothetical protein
MPKPFVFPKRPANSVAETQQQAISASSPETSTADARNGPEGTVQQPENDLQNSETVLPSTQQDKKASAPGPQQDPHMGSTVASNSNNLEGHNTQGGRKELSVEEEALLLRQCRLSKVELIEAALDSNRVGIDFVFSSGDTLLITACKSGFKRLAKCFIQRGCDLNAVDLTGNTAAHWCFASDFLQLGEYLISKGASDTLMNNNGLTCRQLMLKHDNHHAASVHDIDQDARGEHMPPSNRPSEWASNSSRDTSFPPIVNRALSTDPRPHAKLGMKNTSNATTSGTKIFPRDKRKAMYVKQREETPYERMYVNVRAQSTPPTLAGRNHTHNQNDQDDMDVYLQKSMANPDSLSPITHQKTKQQKNTNAHMTTHDSSHHQHSPQADNSAADMSSSPRSSHTHTSHPRNSNNNNNNHSAPTFAGKVPITLHTEESSLKTLENFDQSPMPDPSSRRLGGQNSSTKLLSSTSKGGLGGGDANQNSGGEASEERKDDDQTSVGQQQQESESSTGSKSKPTSASNKNAASFVSKRAGSDVKKTASQGADARIDSPRSIEALKRLGVQVEELLEVPIDRIMRQVKDKKLAEVRFKLCEERRASLLARCRAERYALMARTRDASLNVLFAEFSKVRILYFIF